MTSTGPLAEYQDAAATLNASRNSRSRPIKLECTGCGRRFRLKPVEGKPLPDEVECPRCGSEIEVPREDLGWERRDISRVFGRDEIEKPRPEPGGHAPTPEKKSRVFRDVTQVNPTPVSRGDNDAPSDSTASPGVAAPPAGEDQPDTSDQKDDLENSLGARLRKLKKKRLEVPTLDEESESSQPPEPAGDSLEADFEAIVDEAASAVDDTETATPPVTPEPDPVTPDTDPVTPDTDPVTPDTDPVTPDTDPVTPGRTNEVSETGGSDTGGSDTAASDTAASDTAAPDTDQDVSHRPTPTVEAPYTVRVDNEVHEDLGLDAVAQLVRSGVWTEVVEVQTTEGDWIRLSNSSVMADLRKHLAQEAKSTLKLVASGEWEREPVEPEAPEPAPTPAPEPEEPEPSADDTREPDARRGADDTSSTGAGSKILMLMVAIFTIAAVVGVYQWQQTRTPASDTTAKTPETTSEATKASAPSTSEASAEAESLGPFAAARTAVSDAYDPARVANSLADAGHYKAARHLAIDVWATGRDPQGLQDAFDRAVQDDPALHPEVATLGEDVEIDRVFALGGGRSISFRLTNDGETLYAFKPEQKEWGRGWRAELAAYLFCEVVVCQFEIPRNRPVRISRERFEKLYGLVETYRQARYAERFEDLRWRTERGPDGQEREYLYGVLEAWVPGFVDWPIEYTSIWEDWLDVRYHPGVLDEPLVEELAPLQEKLKQQENSTAYSDILSERGDATTRDVARQLSSMLLFDFLTSNWDRFSDVEAYYGVNNQFADGRFVSLDMGAAFYDERINKVASRFDLVTRFSARTLASVRALSPGVINPVLFPDPTSKEKYRLALFWTQHDEAVQRIDALIDKYGRDRVLEFE